MTTEAEDKRPEATDEPRYDQRLVRLEFHAGIPSEDGYYLVELDQPGLCEDRPYDVDYCRAKSPSDGGGREWVKWYAHNVLRWAYLPNTEGRGADQ